MSTTTASPLSPEQTSLFQETIHMTLYLWDALSISAVNDPRASTPGAIDSIRANLAEAVWDEFCSPTTPCSFSIPTIPSNSSSSGSIISIRAPHPEDLEALLFDFMEQVFDVLVDDDSLIPTAEALVRRFQIVAAAGGGGGDGGNGAAAAAVATNEELVTLRRKFEERKAKGGDRAVKATVGEPNQDTDGSDDEEEGSGSEGGDGEGDVDRMDGVVRQGQQQQVPRREKPVPEVDEDGFTMVSRKR